MVHDIVTVTLKKKVVIYNFNIITNYGLMFHADNNTKLLVQDCFGSSENRFLYDLLCSLHNFLKGTRLLIYIHIYIYIYGLWNQFGLGRHDT